MADIKKYLKGKGYSDEQLAGLPPELLSNLAELATQFEAGETAGQRAEQIKADLETVKKEWNAYVVKSDGRAAAAEAELAKARTYYKTLRDQGYPVPDAMFEGATPPPANAPGTSTPAALPAAPDPYKVMNEAARANMELMSVGGRYTRLTGDYLDPVNEWDDFEKNRRPNEGLRSYVDRKYDLTGKEAAKKAEADQKKLDDYAAEKVKAAQAEWAKSNGPNGETRNPRISRFDTIREDKDRGASWNRARAGATSTDSVDRARVQKYQSLVH